MCNSGGVLITCKNCTTSYHKECVDPPVTRLRENWVCTNCKENPEENHDSKVQNNNDKGSRRSRRSDRESKKYEESEGGSVECFEYITLLIYTIKFVNCNSKKNVLGKTKNCTHEKLLHLI